MQTTCRMAVAACGVALWAMQALFAQDVVFDKRANVNIVNASDVVLTAGNGESPAKLRFAATDSFWEGGSNPPGGVNWIAFDFRRNRNVRTIRIFHYSNSAATGGTIATSDDGIAWTPRTVTWTMTGPQADIVLDAAVDARYLKITATDIQDGNGPDRWLIESLRVFGETGTLTDPDGVVDLVSGTGWNGGVGLTLSGISITDTTTAEYVDDALTPIKRQVLYGVGAGGTITLQFDRDFVVHGLGLAPLASDAGASFDVQVSTNGTDYALAASRTGIDAMATYLTFAPKRARYVRLAINAWPSGTYIGDIQVFGLTPVSNRPPVADNQNVLTAVGGARDITLTATDPDGDPLNWELTSNPAHGALSGTAPDLTYTPVYGYVGSDAFGFRVSDGPFTSAVATVSIEVYPGGTVFFDNRANVNVLNASDAVVTAGSGEPPAKLRFSCTENYWDGQANPPGGTNWLAADFLRPRNIKTIRFSNYVNGGSSATAGWVATSDDGVNWTPRAATWTLAGVQATVTLSVAVDARYLKLVATDIQDGNGTDRWIVPDLRVFGTAGTLVDTAGVIDLVSGTGWTGGVTLTRNGSVDIDGATESEYVNDALDPFERKVLYSIGTGDGFVLRFDRTFVFASLGLNLQGNWEGPFDPNATFTVETSADGVAYTTVLTQTGGLGNGPACFGLTPSSGRYLRWTLTSTTKTDNRLGDISVFGTEPLVPPPSGTTVILR